MWKSGKMINPRELAEQIYTLVEDTIKEDLVGYVIEAKAETENLFKKTGGRED